MIFSERDIDALRMICWCQYMPPCYLRRIVTSTELDNLIHIGFIKCHAKSNAVVLTGKGSDFMVELFGQQIPELTKSYHAAAIQRRLRQSGLAVTAYHGAANFFQPAPRNWRRPRAVSVNNYSKI